MSNNDKNNPLVRFLNQGRDSFSDNNLSKEVNSEAAQKILKKKFEKLRHKALYINLEYEEVDEIFEYAKETFISEMFKYCSERKIKPPLNEGSEENSKDNSDIIDNEEVKELYREIVKNTHPDMLEGLSEEEMEERSDLYRKAVEGKKDGDFYKILKVALELDISVKIITYEYLDEIEKAINKMQAEIGKMKSDLMFKWYYCSEGDRNNIFNQLTKNQEKYE